jgi:isoleucyl-tRNA synthetase
MVEGRPDWVISRQRAWGVPIALYVHRKTGDYLRDEAVNARIVEAFRQGRRRRLVHRRSPAPARQRVQPRRLRAGHRHPRRLVRFRLHPRLRHRGALRRRHPRRHLCRGSDQHRGWFQSSLLESCATRGRAPYAQVLTHGFALDGQGRKMSKSVGNVVDPLAIIRDNGADILRLWVASTDYFEDVGSARKCWPAPPTSYRKLRNTFRYLLGALSDFTDEERVPAERMPELERWVLHRLSELDSELREAAEGYEFNRYTRLLGQFANDDLSAFFFDIRKDSLYCDAPTSLKRRANRTVLDIVFPRAGALVVAGPVLHLRGGLGRALPEWRLGAPADLARDRPRLAGRHAGREVGHAARPAHPRQRGDRARRRAKEIGSSLEAKVTIGYPDDLDRPNATTPELAELFIVSDVGFEKAPSGPR